MSTLNLHLLSHAPRNLDHDFTANIGRVLGLLRVAYNAHMVDLHVFHARLIQVHLKCLDKARNCEVELRECHSMQPFQSDKTRKKKKNRLVAAQLRGYLLDTNALSASLGEIDKILVQREIFLGRPRPPVGVEGVGIGEHSRVSVDKVCGLANGSLFPVSECAKHQALMQK